MLASSLVHWRAVETRWIRRARRILGSIMSVELIREYWAYHHWANRRLFDVVAAVSERATARESAKQSSEPTPRAMLVHMYGADWFWLETWRGRPPAVVRGDASDGLHIRALDALPRCVCVL